MSGECMLIIKDLDDQFKKLSNTEVKILEMLCEGCSNMEIADRLNIHKTTARNYVNEILHKTGSRNRTEAVAKYLTLKNASKSSCEPKN